MGYPQIILRSCWVTILSAQIMSLCTESHGVFSPPLFCYSGLVFFLLYFAACTVLPLPTLHFTFTSQLLPVRRSFRAPTISPIFITSGQFNIANKLPKASSWRGRAFLGIAGQFSCVLLAQLASASSSWWLWEEPGEGGLGCTAAVRVLLVQWGFIHPLEGFLDKHGQRARGMAMGADAWHVCSKTLATSPACNTGSKPPCTNRAHKLLQAHFLIGQELTSPVTRWRRML